MLRELLKYILDFSENDLDVIVSCFKPRAVQKGTILLHEHEVCREFYFVNNGCLRTYFIDRKGAEKTRLILHDMNIGTALTSFISQKPSFEFVDALEHTELMYITHSDFYKLVEEMPSFAVFYRKILEMAYTFQNRRIESLVALDAHERYRQLLADNPILIQKVSNKILASYLDVTQETLSRLKGKR